MSLPTFMWIVIEQVAK